MISTQLSLDFQFFHQPFYTPGGFTIPDSPLWILTILGRGGWGDCAQLRRNAMLGGDGYKGQIEEKIHWFVAALSYGNPGK